MKLKTTRVKKWRFGALASIVITFGVGMATNASAQDITVTSYGGIWEEAITECYAKEFNKRTGFKANVLIGSPARLT